MSRLFFLSLLATAALVPAIANAQSDDQGAGYGYGSFLPGSGASEEEEKDAPQMQWQYDKKYKKAPDPVGPDGKPVKKIVLLPTGQQSLYFVRTADTKPDEAILRLVAPVAIDGCVNVMPPVVTVRKSGNMMALKIEDGAIALDKSPQYAHFQCHIGSGVASADVVLNRRELEERGIKTITFQSMSGGMDTYMVELTPTTLTLVPKTAGAFKPFKGSGKTDPLLYNFYPDNAVILYAPAAPKSDDISADIITLAQSKGLVEGSELKNTSSLYFIDQAGTLAGSLAFDANAYVGTVTAHETFQGPDGPYEKEKQVDVYARKPGMLD